MEALAGIEENKHLLGYLESLVAKQQQLVGYALNAMRKVKQVEGYENQERLVIPKGAACYVWKQDPSVERIGIRKIHLPNEVVAGPKDDLIEVVTVLDANQKDEKTTTLQAPDANGDFLVDFEKNPFQFDMVNTYAIVRMVVDMYVRDLRIDWKWQWDLKLPPGAPKTPLRLVCHAGEKPNAVYHRGKKCLKFYYYTNETTTTYLCRSLDIVAHEAGHAVLDALKPSLYSVTKGQAGALHEAFGDLTAMFLTLEMLDMCEDIVAETKCDLRKAKYLTAIGEQFGDAMKGNTAPRHEDEGDAEAGDQMGMRNMNNTIQGSCCPNDVHSLASIFTGFVFDFLVEVFNWERDPDTLSDAETLHRVGRIVRRILLLALFNSGPSPDFVELATHMSKAVETISADDPADVPEYQRILLFLKDSRELQQAGGN